MLADVLIFSFVPLYPAYAAQDERLLGFSPLRDQRSAGVVMMLEQLLRSGRARRCSSGGAAVAGAPGGPGTTT